MNDREVFEEMLKSAGCTYKTDEKWNALGVIPATGGSPLFFLFDAHGNMYSLPEDKHEEWKADHTRVVEIPSTEPALAIEVDAQGKHYVYEPEAEPERWERQQRRESNR